MSRRRLLAGGLGWNAGAWAPEAASRRVTRACTAMGRRHDWSEGFAAFGYAPALMPLPKHTCAAHCTAASLPAVPLFLFRTWISDPRSPPSAHSMTMRHDATPLRRAPAPGSRELLLSPQPPAACPRPSSSSRPNIRTMNGQSRQRDSCSSSIACGADINSTAVTCCYFQATATRFCNTRTVTGTLRVRVRQCYNPEARPHPPACG